MRVAIRTLSVRFATSLYMAASALTPSPVVAQANAPPPGDSVVIRITVPTNYSGTKASVSRATQLIQALPAIVDTLPTAQTYHELIFKTYGVSVGPRAARSGKTNEVLFDTLARRIAALNQLDIANNEVPAGPIRLPALLPAATWGSDSTKLHSALPVAYATSAVMVPVSANGRDSVLALSGRFVAAATSSPSQQRGTLLITVPAAQAEDFLKNASSLFGGGRATIEAATIAFTYQIATDDGRPIGSGLLAKPVVDSLSKLLAHPVRMNVPLILVESAWPDSVTAAVSCARILGLLANVRAKWGLGKADIQACDLSRYRNSSYDHSVDVMHSLSQLARIGNEAIAISIVPMSRDQGAGPLLGELLRVATLQSFKQSALIDSVSKRNAVAAQCGFVIGRPATFAGCARALPLAASYDSVARAYAAGVVSRLKDRIVADQGNDKFESTSAILTAVVSLLGAYSEAESRGAVVSTSWVVPSLLAGTFTAATKTPSVLVVAAAGNDRRIVNADDTPVELARWASTTAQVLAVINLDSTGATVCRTSYVDTSSAIYPRTNIVGFNGDLEGRACGTSFSAPRIAWFIAAAEARRSTPFSFSNWSAAIAGRLAAQRDPRRTPFADVAFDPLRFLTRPDH